MLERQTNFSAGELAPTLHGRNDLELYAAGARTLLNFIATPHGILQNRAGFAWASQILDGSARLIPWYFSDTESRILVFYYDSAAAMGKMAPLKYNASTGQVEAYGVVDTPYTTNLSTLRFAQLGRKMTIVSPNYAPYELIDSDGNATYTFNLVSFDVPDYPTDAKYGTPGLTIEWGNNHINGTTQSPNLPTREWTYKVTRVLQGSDGYTYETKPVIVAVPGQDYYLSGNSTDDDPSVLSTTQVGNNRHALYPENEQAVGWKITSDAVTQYPKLISTRIYRGRGGSWGYVGETAVIGQYVDSLGGATAYNTYQWFVDSGSEPDYSDPPPAGRNPFDELGNPSTVTYFEGRRYFGGFPNFKQRVISSAVERYANYDLPIPADDDDALEFELATSSNESIVGMVPKRQLLVFTNSSEWACGGTQDQGLLTPNSIAARIYATNGSSGPAPIAIGNYILFVSGGGSRPMALAVGDEAKTIDLSLPARHLFDGYTITDWCYQKVHDSIVWCVRSDGALLSLTFAPDYSVAAWSKHELGDDATVSSVSCVHEDNMDALYAVILHGDDYKLERLNTRLVTDVRYGLFLDHAHTYDGHSDTRRAIESYAATGVTVADAAPGDDQFEVTFTADTSAGSFVGKVVQLPHPTDGSYIHLQLDSYTGPHYVASLLSAEVPAAVLDVEYTEWFWAINSMPAASLPDGAVGVVADGNYFEATATSGSVSLGELTWAGVVHVGIRYDCDFESLDVAPERGRRKIVKEVIVEMESSRGGLVGPVLSETKMQELRTRLLEHKYGAIPLRRSEESILVSDKWANTGRIAFRQNVPLPVSVLGISREVEYGGK